MEENKKPQTGAAGGSHAAEATSSETLSDLEETQKVSGGGAGSGTNDNAGGNSGSSPAPDSSGVSGEINTGRADGSDSGGPM